MDRILIVDDEMEVLSVLEEFFSLRGYEVHTAADGPSGLAKVRDVMPQMVLLDIVMPGMGGIEALEKIRRINPDVTVVMVTAVSDEDLARESLSKGAADYITKPLDLEHIETVVMVKLLEQAP